jgi:hypothetical protein
MIDGLVDRFREARWALEDWAEGAGDDWTVVPAKEPGEAYHLKRKGRRRDVLYCTVPGTTTTVPIHEATPADVESLRALLSDQWIADESRDGTRVHVDSREMAKVASWNRLRLRL